MLENASEFLTKHDIALKDFVPVIGTLAAAFIGGYFAFLSQRISQRSALKQKHKDELIRIYRQNHINFQTLLTYKSSFLSSFEYGFLTLEGFLSHYVDAPIGKKAYLREKWQHIYRCLTKLSPSYLGDPETGLYKLRWEKPELLSFDLQAVSSVAISSPDILGVTAYLRSTLNFLESELKLRDKYAESLTKYEGDRHCVMHPHDDFAKDLFILLRCRSDISQTLERAIALSFGLNALLENHYLKIFNRVDFAIILFSKENLDMIKCLEENQNFFGEDKSYYIVKTRYERALNAARGHKELNFRTSIMPENL